MTINTHAQDSPDDVHEFILQELDFLRRQLSEAIDRQRLLFGVVAPRVSGGDPTEWICGIERYYDLSLTTESDRLELVPLLIDSPASEWLCFFQKNNPEASWQEFLLAIRRRFVPDFYEDVVDREDALKLAPQFAASHAESHTNGPLTPKDGTVAGVPISSAQVNVLSPVVVPPSATLLATSSSLEVQPEPPATVYESKGMKLPNSKTTAMPDSKTTALPDSPTTAQHGHSLLTYCEDAEWSRASHQLVAETEVRIFDPGAFDGVEFIHVEPDKISEDVLDGDLALQIEEAKSIQSIAAQSSNGFTSLAASHLLSTFELGQGDETALSHGKEGNGSEADGDYIQLENTIFFFVPDSTEWCQHVRLDEIVIDKAGFVSPVSKHVNIAECFGSLVNTSTSVGSRIRTTILGIEFQRQAVKGVDTTEMYGAFFVEGETHTVKVKKCSEATPKDVKSVGKDLFSLSQASDGRAIPPRMNVTRLGFSEDELIFAGSILDYSFMFKEAVWCYATRQFGDEIGVRIFDPGPFDVSKLIRYGTLEALTAALSIGVHYEGEHRAGTTGVVVEAKIWCHFRSAYFFFPP